MKQLIRLCMKDNQMACVIKQLFACIKEQTPDNQQCQ